MHYLFAHKNEWSIGGIKYDSTNFSHKEREKLIKKYALINTPCGAWDFSRKIATMARKFNSENYKQKTQRHKEKLRTIEKNKGNGFI